MVDPLNNLHFDVFDLIFQHLSWRELAVSSEVCSRWYKAIAESRVCMDKAEVKISNFAHRPSCYNSLHALHMGNNSQRQYRHITADFSDRSRQSILKILKPKCRKWRSVHLLNEHFANGKFVLNFCDTVERLTLTRVQCDNNTDSLNILQFPRLKELKLLSCNENLVKIFGKCSSLRKLQVIGSAGCEGAYSDILVNNAELEDLSICVRNISTVFSAEVIEAAKFKLKKIAIECSNNEFAKKDKRLLKSLLQKQSQNLQIVHLNPWCGTDIIETCWIMKRLKDISLNVLHCDDDIAWRRLSLPINPTIQRINICDVSKHEDASFYEAIFKSAPNLKIYKSKCMQPEDFSILSSNCKHLQELYIEEFDICSLPADPLPNVEKFRSWDVNDNLLQNLRTKISRNSFENKILNNE